jgi:hypothetical protein
MPGFLITPEQYFLSIFDKPARDFAGCQMNLLDNRFLCVLYAEVKTLSFDKSTETLSVECTWAVEQAIDQEPQRLSGAELNLTLPLVDHYGVSHDDGGCHFEPGLEAKTQFVLHPPGTFEKSDDAETWQRLKAIGLGTAQ